MRNNLPLSTLTNQQESRIWERINKQSPVDCWDWLGTKREGYGRIRINGILYGVTRLVYFLTHGTDPGSCLVLHSCDNPSCCNPRHLHLGTDGDNNQEKEDRKRAQHPIGELNGLAKLTEKDVLTIRHSTATNVTLAEIYGVSDVAISCLRRGKTWTHVGGPIRQRPRGRPSTLKVI